MHLITAQYSGDDWFEPNSVPVTQTVERAAVVVALTSSEKNSSDFGMHLPGA